MKIDGVTYDAHLKKVAGEGLILLRITNISKQPEHTGGIYAYFFRKGSLPDKSRWATSRPAGVWVVLNNTVLKPKSSKSKNYVVLMPPGEYDVILVVNKDGKVHYEYLGTLKQEVDTLHHQKFYTRATLQGCAGDAVLIHFEAVNATSGPGVNSLPRIDVVLERNGKIYTSHVYSNLAETVPPGWYTILTLKGYYPKDTTTGKPLPGKYRVGLRYWYGPKVQRIEWLGECEVKGGDTLLPDTIKLDMKILGVTPKYTWTTASKPEVDWITLKLWYKVLWRLTGTNFVWLVIKDMHGRTVGGDGMVVKLNSGTVNVRFASRAFKPGGKYKLYWSRGVDSRYFAEHYVGTFEIPSPPPRQNTQAPQPHIVKSSNMIKPIYSPPATHTLIKKKPSTPEKPVKVPVVTPSKPIVTHTGKVSQKRPVQPHDVLNVPVNTTTKVSQREIDYKKLGMYILGSLVILSLLTLLRKRR